MVHTNTYDYSKKETNITDRRRTFATGGRIQVWIRPQIPFTLSRHTAQERESFQCGSRAETGCGSSISIQLDKKILGKWNIRIENEARAGSQAHNGLFGRGIGTGSCLTGTPECEIGQVHVGKSLRQEGKPYHLQTFFRGSGARYKRIPRRPRVTPSPQLHAIKREKLQELENLNNQGLIDLFFGDESHVCTQGYVPYGWQFPGEDVFVPSMKAARLNIFGMISRDNVYHGFTSRQGIKAENVAEFIDNFSMSITRPTFIVLDNASVHTGGKMKESPDRWRKRGLHIFFLPPYSPHLNIAQTLCRILKTKWTKPHHYINTNSLFNATNEILDCTGGRYRVNYNKVA